jgi:GNAT superfamily N-acetyltransferase
MISSELAPFSEEFYFDDFHSKNEEVNNFLKERAIIETADNTTKIYVAHVDRRIIAYVAIMCSHYRYKPVGFDTEFRVPGLLIGQLGVDERFEHKGIGSMLIDYCISIVMEIKTLAACRIIYVESFDDAIAFYQKHQFILLDNHVKDRNKMVLDLRIA